MKVDLLNYHAWKTHPCLNQGKLEMKWTIVTIVTEALHEASLSLPSSKFTGGGRRKVLNPLLYTFWKHSISDCRQLLNRLADLRVHIITSAQCHQLIARFSININDTFLIHKLQKRFQLVEKALLLRYRAFRVINTVWLCCFVWLLAYSNSSMKWRTSAFKSTITALSSVRP